jgi:site-specific DNA-cytosine methylase
MLIGREIGVENFIPPENVWGIIANPVCAEFSTAKGFHKENDIESGMFLVRHCQRIIESASPKWWVIENPSNGKLKDVIGNPKKVY